MIVKNILQCRQRLSPQKRVNLFWGSNFSKIRRSITTTKFNYLDPFFLNKQLTSEELMIQKIAEELGKDLLFPTIVKSFRDEKFDKNIIKNMGYQLVA